jgi:hypothetical protein
MQKHLPQYWDEILRNCKSISSNNLKSKYWAINTKLLGEFYRGTDRDALISQPAASGMLRHVISRQRMQTCEAVFSSLKRAKSILKHVLVLFGK